MLSMQAVSANNLQVSNIQIASIDNIGQTAQIQFDISWENSWRDTENWDAAWIFIKYKDVNATGAWQHASLNYVDGSNDGHTAPAGSSISTPADGKGAFIYRSANGDGTTNFVNTRLQWNYGQDGLLSINTVDIKVFAIEMVYVPQGSYYLGDGQTDAGQIYGNFEEGSSGNPFQVTSEAAITLGGGAAGSLGNNNGSNMHVVGGCGCLGDSGDDFNDVSAQTLPAAFPKGFDAFYCMKYEMTQQQVVDMLNCSTPAQQTTIADTSNYYPFFGATIATSRFGISETAGTYTTTEPHLPYVYCDWVRAAAYADWAALRPMSELEFEKACRGFEMPVAGEYAWGNANADLSDNFTQSNLSLPSEGIASGYSADGVSGNVWVRSGSQNMTTIARVGIFAANPANTGRVSSGASVWGIMELSGNAWERVVSVGHTMGRQYTGEHGDGVLEADGYANTPNWPGAFIGTRVTENIAVGYRGGGFIYPTTNLHTNGYVSSRRVNSSYYNTIIQDDGARFVRTAN